MRTKRKSKRSYGFYAEATKPAGGWKAAGVNTPHGARLINLFSSSTLHPNASPSTIWNANPDLRVVHTKRFPDFVRRCRARFSQDQEHFNADPFNEHEADSFNNQDSSDDEASILEHPARM